MNSRRKLLVYTDPYQAYTEAAVLNAGPIELVLKIYEAVIDAVRQARERLDAGDIPARGKAITKAMNGITQLLLSLDFEKGGELSRNLQRLYTYMHRRLLEAHAQQKREAMDEVEALLRKLLGAWQQVAEDTGNPGRVFEDYPVVPGVVAASYSGDIGEPGGGFSVAF